MTANTETLSPTSEAEADAVSVRVVLVDSRPDRRAVMRQVFEHSGVDAAVVGEADGEADAVALVEQHGAELAVVELPMPLRDGLATVAALRHRFPDLAIVVISFNTDVAVKEQALADGADAYLLKPVSAREVVAAIPATPDPSAAA
ncbi:MAG: response regulator transcription factor [Acidimicrobiales bacterium]